MTEETWFNLVVLGLVGLLVGALVNRVAAQLPYRLMKNWADAAAASYEAEHKLEELSVCASASADDAVTEQGNYGTLSWLRCRCPQCQTPLSLLASLPLVGLLFASARPTAGRSNRPCCVGCGESLPVREPLIDVLCLVMLFGLWFEFGWGVQLMLAVVLAATLLALALIDFDHFLLPDDLVLPLLWVGLLTNVNGLFCPLDEAVLGAAVGYLALWLCASFFRLITGKEGMGHGDFKLVAALGGWFGWTVLPQLVLIAASLGIVAGVSMIALGLRDRNQPVPFGPFIALGGWAVLMFEDSLHFMAFYH